MLLHIYTHTRYPRNAVWILIAAECCSIGPLYEDLRASVIPPVSRATSAAACAATLAASAAAAAATASAFVSFLVLVARPSEPVFALCSDTWFPFLL